MKTSILSVVCAIVLGNQIAYSGSGEVFPSDSLCGKKGLTFQFSGLYLGGGLGGKYWISSSTALRGQLIASYSNTINYDNNYSNLSISLGIERHFESSNRLSPYVGGSLGFVREGSADYFTYGGEITAIIGLEFWIYNSITLSGEQCISFQLLGNGGNELSRRFKVYSKTSALLLSVYF